MENTLYQIFTSDYDRTSFEENVLKPIFKESAQKFVLYDKDGEQEIQLTETDLRTAKKVVKYGEFITHDNRKVELYEITVEDFSKVKIARVGLGALVKKLIIGNNAVFATFRYENVTDKHWRFSFIAYDSFFQDGQVQTTETNPKRYTYVFGDEHETYRTAIDRFLELGSKNNIKVKDIQDAFAVEAMSKEFFDEYRETHYAKFIKYLTGDEFVKKGGKYELVPVQKPSPFLASVFNGDKVIARDFCKKLLGQIVFLYFLQKKGWMGSPTGNYKSADGDKNFMENFFSQSGANDTFYTVWLTKLFYETLNKERENDDFEMPDKSIVKIPYLNGGLFDKESEKYDFLTFPKELFADLFKFFNRFNFTIYENSPEEHTVAVDPEMLGHIFENLLEDNKDKGTFYTPKEIVHYMTQESLIEYLVTNLGENTKEGVDLFVKQKNKEQLSDEHLNEINSLLDNVKICDPAIGSGAFPMGLLQEIFMLKERIAFDLGYSVWSPATVKENIIQNSIYGVDIEKGAVDIAQLRFWLSLIVDADVPKALPNLAYKIVVGNSLVSKFEDEVIEIDWDRKGSVGEADKHVKAVQTALKSISEKQKQFFKSKNKSQKESLKSEIRKLKLDVLINQLSYNKASYLNKNQKVIDMGFGLKNSDNKKNIEIDFQISKFDQILSRLQLLKEKPELPFKHFDWKLDFPELLNPLIIEEEEKKRGFDIIIGNPPYVSAVTMRRSNEEKKIFKNKYPEISGSYDLYVLFLLLVRNIGKKEGMYTWIVPNKVLISDYSKSTLKFLKDNGLKSALNVSSFNVFKGVGVYPIILTGKILSAERVFVEYFLEEYSDLKNGIFKRVKELPDYPTLKSLGIKLSSGTTGFEAQKIKGLVSSSNSDSKIPFTVSGNIDRYKFNNENVQFMKKRYSYAYIDKVDEIADSKWKFWLKPKIVIAGMTKVIEAVYVSKPLALGVGIYGIYDFNGISPYALTAMLNSKYLSFYFRNKFKDKHLAGGYLAINKSTIEEFPILKPNENQEFILKNSSSYLHNIAQNMGTIQIHPEVPNSHLAEVFEEVIDAVVFELYFPEEFVAKDIDIEKYANNIFKPIDGLSEEEQLETIRETYQILREKDNPLRNQIKLMKIELKELLLPILSV